MAIITDNTAISAVTDAERLKAVRATNLLDTPNEQDFDRLTRLAAKLTGAPVTFISLVDQSRDFYKSCYGFPEPLASQRELTGTTFCHYALLSDGPLVIEDTLENPTYRNVPTVESLGVRAYLGVPLVVDGNHTIGSFCAIDFQPRRWSKLDIEVMTELAASTLREIELRSALRTLEERRLQLDVLMRSIPLGVVFAEAPTGKLVLFNRCAEELLGGAPAPRTREKYGEWVGLRPDGSKVQPSEWPIARALNGEVVTNEEILFERPDGKHVWLRISGAPVRDLDGNIVGGVVAFDNVDRELAIRNENVRLYEEAQNANRAKDEFFAAVTHELRTPMTAIIGWAAVLRGEQLLNQDAMEAVNAISSSARLQAQLVDDLLDVARIATGKLTLKVEEIRLDEMIEEALNAARPAAEGKSVILRQNLCASCSVMADRSRMRQIVGNLLSNAVKFTPAGGFIEVSTRTEDGFATIVVKDTGRGIESSLLPHIFERYRQEKSAEMGGLGLGLTIVKHLIELHGGDVRAESEGAGKGATFTVRLPVTSPV